MKDLYSVYTVGFNFKALTGVLLSVLGFFFDVLLFKVFLIVIVLTLIDCGLGYYRAFNSKTHIASKVMRNYMWKFVGYMIATMSLFLMSNAMPEAVQPFTGWLDNFALAFFAVHEAISIIEHLNEMGVPLPTRLLGNLRKVKEIADPEEVDKYAQVKATQEVKVDGEVVSKQSTTVNVPPKV